jgi:hypothetical protein
LTAFTERKSPKHMGFLLVRGWGLVVY